MVLKPPAILRAEAEEEQRRAISAARLLGRRCAEELGAVRVLLFGSRARADWHRSSDCDVLVVSDAFEGMTLSDRWKAIHDRWDRVVELNPIGITPAEFELGKRGSGIEIHQAHGIAGVGGGQHQSAAAGTGER